MQKDYGEVGEGSEEKLEDEKGLEEHGMFLKELGLSTEESEMFIEGCDLSPKYLELFLKQLDLSSKEPEMSLEENIVLRGT